MIARCAHCGRRCFWPATRVTLTEDVAGARVRQITFLTVRVPMLLTLGQDARPNGDYA